MQKIGDHAVVLGASMAGLLAARVLSDAYQRVTVVDRDTLPNKPGIGGVSPRAGTPTCWCPEERRSLTSSSRDYSTTWSPGCSDDPGPRGAALFPSRPSALPQGRPAQPFICQASRPFLEGQVRARVRALPAVEILDRCEVVGLVTTLARTGSPGCGSCPMPPVSRRPSTPIWSWTPPDAAAARRPGWQRSATTSPGRAAPDPTEIRHPAPAPAPRRPARPEVRRHRCRARPAHRPGALRRRGGPVGPDGDRVRPTPPADRPRRLPRVPRERRPARRLRRDL